MTTYEYMPGQEVVVKDRKTGETMAGLYAYTLENDSIVVDLPHGVSRAFDAEDVHVAHEPVTKDAPAPETTGEAGGPAEIDVTGQPGGSEGAVVGKGAKQ